MRSPSCTLVPAARFPVARLVALINQAYADYLLTVRLDVSQFTRMCVEEDVRLEESIVAVVDNEPVGITLLSVRGQAGWVSGVGVLPQWRRMGIARRILGAMQKRARLLDIDSLWLEVLVQNDAGIALYQQLGFDRERDLLVLTRESDLPVSSVSSPALRPAKPEMLLQSFATFHDVRSPWQRDYATLRHRIADLQGFGYWDGADLVGYILYEFQPHQLAILDLAVDPARSDRVRVARRLLEAAHARRRDIAGYIINLPAEDPLLAAFKDVQYRVWQRQYEMIWRAL